MKKLLIGFVLLAASAVSWSQANRASITGTVKDSSGAVIPGAEVVATNLGTADTMRTTTDSSGSYRLADLSPAVYRITYSHAGFKTYTQESVKLDVGQLLELDPDLAVGSNTEKVIVTTAPSTLETATATVGDVVPTRSVEGLPLNVRDTFALVTLTAGVQLGGNFGNGGATDVGRGFYRDDFNVGGGRSGTQEMLIDGAPNTTADGLNEIDPPVDAVQEFKVQAASYDAQYGRTSGGVVNMITKSGTNDFHGTLYDFQRHSVMDANTYFNNQSHVKLPSFARNQFGATVGGPIRREKLFFFGDYEGLRQGYPNTAISTVPTAAEKTGDFSGLVTSSGTQIKIYDPLSSTTQRTQFQSNGVLNVIPPNRIDPVAAAVMALYPAPNRATTATNQNNYIFSSKSITNGNKFDIRGDYTYSDATKVFVRWGQQFDTRLSTGTLPLPIGGGRSVQDSYTLGVINLTHVFTPHLLADVETSFGRSWGAQVGRSDGFDLSSIKLPSSYTSLVAHQFPVFNIGDITGTSNGSDAIVSKQPRNDYATTGNVYLQRGRHGLKFGGDFRNIFFNEGQNSTPAGNFQFNRGYTQGPTPTQASSSSGFGLASFLLGAPASGSVNIVNRISTHGVYYAAYAQDDWLVNDRLTLNLGLRWDVSVGDTEKYNRLAYFNPTEQSPLGIPNLMGDLDWVGQNNPKSQQATRWLNFGPRFGFAYKLTPKTVARGGYGIFFLPRHIAGNGAGAVEAVRTTTMVASLDNGVTPYNYISNPYPQGLLPALNDRNPLANIGTSFSAPEHSFVDGYSQAWSFGVQRELPHDIVVDVHYWANKITHLPQSFNIDQLPDQYLSLGTALNQQVPNPFYGYITTGALSGKTISRQQSLLPYPQYTGITQVYAPQAASTYNAGTVQVDKRMSPSLTLLANYTWSKALDNARTPLDNYNRQWEKSYSSFSIPQMAHISFVYALPYGKNGMFGSIGNKFANTILGDWSLSGIVNLQSGLPVGVNRPAVMASGDPKLSKPTIQKWFNTSLFTVAPAYTYGNVGPYLRDVRTQAMHNLDAVLAKDFNMTTFDRPLTVTFRAEAYNVTNTVQFGFPNSSPTSQSFGQVTSALNSPRDLQLAVKVKF